MSCCGRIALKSNAFTGSVCNYLVSIVPSFCGFEALSYDINKPKY